MNLIEFLFKNCVVDDFIFCVGGNRKGAACADKAGIAAPLNKRIAGLARLNCRSSAVRSLFNDHIVVQIAVIDELDYGAANGDFLQNDVDENLARRHGEEIAVYAAVFTEREQGANQRNRFAACHDCHTFNSLQNIALGDVDCHQNALAHLIGALTEVVGQACVIRSDDNVYAILGFLRHFRVEVQVAIDQNLISLCRESAVVIIDPDIAAIVSALGIVRSIDIGICRNDKDVNEIVLFVIELDRILYGVLRPDSDEVIVTVNVELGVLHVVGAVCLIHPRNEGIAFLVRCGRQNIFFAVVQRSNGFNGVDCVIQGYRIGDFFPDCVEDHHTIFIGSNGEVLHAAVGIDIAVIFPAREDIAVLYGIGFRNGSILSVIGKEASVNAVLGVEADEAAQLGVFFPNSRQEDIACGHGVLRACRMHVAVLIDPALEDIAGERRLRQDDGIAVGHIRQNIGRHIGRVVVEELNKRAVGQRKDALILGGIRLCAAVIGEVVGVDLEERDISLVRVDRIKFAADGIFLAGRERLPADEGVALLDRLHGSCGRLAGENVLKAVNRVVHEELCGVAVRLLDDLHRHRACGHYEGVAVHVRRVIGIVCRQRGDRNGNHFAVRVPIVDADIVGLEACLGGSADGDDVTNTGLCALGNNADLHMLARNEGDRICVRLIDGTIGHILRGDGGVIQQIAVLVLPAGEGVAFLGRCHGTGTDQFIFHDEAGIHQIALFGDEQDRIGVGNDRRQDDVASDGDVVGGDSLTDRKAVHVAGGQHPLGIGIQGVLLVVHEEFSSCLGGLLDQIDILQRAVGMAELDRPVFGIRSKDGKEIQVGRDAEALQFAHQEELAVVAVPAEELHAVWNLALIVGNREPVAVGNGQVVVRGAVGVKVKVVFICRIVSLDHRISSDGGGGIGIPSAGVAVLFGNCRNLRQRLAVADGVLRDLIAVGHEGHGVQGGSLDGEGGIAGDVGSIFCVVLSAVEHPGRCRIIGVSGKLDCGIGGLFDQRDIIQVAVLADELDRPILGVVLEERGHDQRVGVLHEVAQTGHIQVAILAAPCEEALTVGNIPCVVNGSEVLVEVDRLNAHGRLLSLCEAVLDVAGHCLIFRRHGQIAGDGLGQVSVPLAVVAVGFGNCRDLSQRLAVADGVLGDLIAVCHKGHGILCGSLDGKGGVAGNCYRDVRVVLHNAIRIVQRPERIGIGFIGRHGDDSVLSLLDKRDIIQIAVFTDELNRPVFRVALKNRFHPRGSGRLPGIGFSGKIEVAVVAAPAEEILSVGHIAGVVGNLIAAAIGDIVRKGFR